MGMLQNVKANTINIERKEAQKGQNYELLAANAYLKNYNVDL
jgi:hypothetical protein